MGDEYRGEQIDYWENGQLQHKVYYQYGKKQGEEISYMMDGKALLKGYYINGERDGDFCRYYSNGKLEIKDEFRKGIAGNKIGYYENGKVRYNCTIENDIRLCYNFFENGKLQFESKENLTTKISSILEYDENGKITNQEFHDENGNEITDKSVIENFN